MTGRGTSNSNQRGSSEARRARRLYLLEMFGDGETCPCYRCGEDLDDSTVQADRILAGMDGGTYERGNLRPACGACNIATGNALREHRKRFPYGHLVKFKGASRVTLWRVVDGESEAFLELESVRSGARRHTVDRARLVDSGIMYGPNVLQALANGVRRILDGLQSEPTRDDFALVNGGKR